MNKTSTEEGRWFLKSRWPELSQIETDRQKRKPLPSMQKDAGDYPRISLPPTEELQRSFGADTPLSAAIAERQTHRKYSEKALSFEELAYLLWASQGVRKQSSKVSFRTVPSGGARHPFETYLFVQRVDELEPGLYRYLPLDNQLLFLKAKSDFSGDMEKLLNEALLQHNFNAAVTFLWAAVPYRSEWSYASEAARLILLDAGHACQNLYLACEPIGCGTCAVGAYDQEQIDRLIGLDGKDEFVVYAAPVGKRLKAKF